MMSWSTFQEGNRKWKLKTQQIQNKFPGNSIRNHLEQDQLFQLDFSALHPFFSVLLFPPTLALVDIKHAWYSAFSLLFFFNFKEGRCLKMKSHLHFSTMTSAVFYFRESSSSVKLSELEPSKIQIV